MLTVDLAIILNIEYFDPLEASKIYGLLTEILSNMFYHQYSEQISKYDFKNLKCLYFHSNVIP